MRTMVESLVYSTRGVVEVLPCICLVWFVFGVTGMQIFGVQSSSCVGRDSHAPLEGQKFAKCNP